MNERGQIDMWRFVRWAPNLSTADYHLLMSTAVCVSPRFSLLLCRMFFLLPGFVQAQSGRGTIGALLIGRRTHQ